MTNAPELIWTVSKKFSITLFQTRGSGAIISSLHKRKWLLMCTIGWQNSLGLCWSILPSATAGTWTFEQRVTSTIMWSWTPLVYATVTTHSVTVLNLLTLQCYIGICPPTHYKQWPEQGHLWLSTFGQVAPTSLSPRSWARSPWGSSSRNVKCLYGQVRMASIRHVSEDTSGQVYDYDSVDQWI